MKLCVFQGTFNPIHNGHIKMAEHVLANYDFDKLLIIPAFKPPHKDYDEALTPHRLQMAELAVKNISKLEISDIEYKIDRTSYTYLTIKELYERYNIEDKIHFIIGTDAFKNIDSWYKAEELKKLIKFIIFKRENETEFHINSAEYEYTTMPLYDISSTEIRDKIKAGEQITGLVSEEVERYIERNKLYK